MCEIKLVKTPCKKYQTVGSHSIWLISTFFGRILLPLVLKGGLWLPNPKLPSPSPMTIKGEGKEHFKYKAKNWGRELSKRIGNRKMRVWEFYEVFSLINWSYANQESCFQLSEWVYLKCVRQLGRKSFSFYY